MTPKEISFLVRLRNFLKKENVCLVISDYRTSIGFSFCGDDFSLDLKDVCDYFDKITTDTEVSHDTKRSY